MDDKWAKAQEWESSWWSSCTNTLGEEIKQLEYSKRMGLEWTSKDGRMCIDAEGKSILDIGGGAVSMLLKVTNSTGKVVVDPCDYPQWTAERYIDAGVMPYKMRGEDLPLTRSDFQFDEAWIYNCLQHTEDPQRVIENAKTLGKTIRIFEWVNSHEDVGHLHILTPDKLNEWLGGIGRVESMAVNGCYGTAYFGVFNYGQKI